VTKASRLTMKGLDPNFIDADTGGTFQASVEMYCIDGVEYAMFKYI